MSELQDPHQGTPEGGEQAPKEQGGAGSTSTPAIDPVEARFAKLEASYKEAQRKITLQGQELARYKQQVQTPPDNDEELYSLDSVAATKKIVTSALTEFERRQQEQRQAEQYLERFARERNIPAHELQDTYEQLANAANDRNAMLEVLATLHRAQNIETQLSQVQQTAQDNATRNARAVTTQSGNQQQTTPAKEFEQMTLAEQRQYLVDNLGVNRQ